MKKVVSVGVAMLSVGAALAASGDSLSEKSVSELLEEHRSLECRIEERIKRDNSPFVITNVSSVYTAAAIHSRKSIPVLLDFICAKPLNQTIPKRAVPVSALDYSKGIMPDMSHVHWAPAWYYVVPPTPASAALTQTPIGVETLLSELSSAETGSERMQLLAWVAMARHGDSFLREVREKVALMDTLPEREKWNWIFDYSSTNLVGSAPFDFRQFAGKMWQDVVGSHERLSDEFRRRIQWGKETDNAALVAEATTALIEIGETPEPPKSPETVQRDVPPSLGGGEIALDDVVVIDIEEEDDSSK